jgi:hypothetical protein
MKRLYSGRGTRRRFMSSTGRPQTGDPPRATRLISMKLDRQSESLDIESPWGWMFDLKVHNLVGWHFAWEIGLRVAGARYVGPGGEVDATNVGFGLGLHFNL